jgi:hypothetical protein
MELIQDYTHPTPHGGQCRVRIYQGASTRGCGRAARGDLHGAARHRGHEYNECR